MQLFDVYPLMNVTPENTRSYYIWNINGKQCLDLYGGFSAISFGHWHRQFVQRITQQLEKMAAYSIKKI